MCEAVRGCGSRDSLDRLGCYLGTCYVVLRGLQRRRRLGLSGGALGYTCAGCSGFCLPCCFVNGLGSVPAAVLKLSFGESLPRGWGFRFPALWCTPATVSVT